MTKELKKSALGFKLLPILKRQLQEVEPKSKKIYAELFIETLIEKATIDKDIQAYKIIISYIDGLPKQTVEVDTGAGLNNLLREINGINSGEQNPIGEQELEDEQSVQDSEQSRSTSYLPS